MNLLAIRAELEEERTWRTDELRFMQNQMAEMPEENREQYRRALLLLLYAHFEGFCRVALRIYVRELNLLHLRVREVSHAVAAATCRPILMALSDHNQKNDFFRHGAPSDSALHFAWRSQEFLARLSDVLNSVVSIPDAIVDTESNLWPIVLKKNLFKLGFAADCLSQHDSTISNLVNRRNNIGHGMERAGIEQRVFANLQSSVYEVMDSISQLITSSLGGQTYLQQSRLPPIRSEVQNPNPPAQEPSQTGL